MTDKVKQRRIGVTELVLRDGHQSLIATRMRFEDMLPICERLDQAGFWSLEMWGGATFDACVRYLREDPWERLRTLRKALPRTRLQMLLRGQNLLGYRHYADDVVEAFVARCAENGMDVFRIFDALNDFRNMEVAVRSVIKTGKHAQGAISYTTSPIHTIEGFVELAQKFADAGCSSIAIKDMAGIMSPAAAYSLVRAIRQKLDLPIHVHCHSTSGMAAMALLKGVDAGADVIDTAISPFAEGASHPATETMVNALAGTPYDTGLDIKLLGGVAEYFRHIRRKYWQYESEFTGVDPRVVEHHVPGGMISNLSNQLKEQNALDRMDEVFEEIPRVRRDLGYPPLVTPSSQIVGSQALINVLTGERYKTMTNEVKNYLRGLYGAPPGECDADLQRKALDGEKFFEGRPADLLPQKEMERLTSEIDQFSKSKEDVLTYAMFPDMARTYLQERAADQLEPEPLLPKPMGEQQQAAEASANAPTEFEITLHGETYNIQVMGMGHKGAVRRPVYMTIDGIPEEALVEVKDEIPVDMSASARPRIAAGGGKRPQATSPGHVTTVMPGTVIDVLVAEGQDVKKGESVLVLEAMKMESEIQAPVDGKVIGILVEKGDRVEPKEVLMEIG